MIKDIQKHKEENNYLVQIIALINQKGGVGKTACAINIGAGLNKPNKKGDRVYGPLSLSVTELEEKRREIIKEWIDSGRIEDINNT